jgi:phospholipid/cholesterol/gamma-HCH transport system substrate-binding protein
VRRAWRIVGAVCAAISVALLGGCALSLQTLPKITGNSNPTYPVRAIFANVLNLPDDAQVRVGAQVVGQVGQISTKNFQADLVLDIDKSVHLPVDSTAQIRFDNPLGDEYVLIVEPGGATNTLTASASPGASSATPGAATASTADSGQFLAPNSLIPESDTSTAPSVEDTFGALSLVLNGGGINQLQTIIHKLKNTFNGNQPEIRSFLTTIDNAFTSLAGGRTAIDNALTSIDNLTGKLNGGRQTISNGINTIAPAIGVLASENTQISSLFTQLSNLGTIGTQVAQQSGENGVNDLRALLPVVQQLESVSQQIGPDLGALATFEADSTKVAPGDYLQANVITNVFLPSGGFEPTPLGSFGSTAAVPDTESTGSKAVTGILESGLL